MPRFNKRILLGLILLFALPVLLFASRQYQETRSRAALTDKPNIVVFMLDDMPYIDDRVWNRLPNIKSLFLDKGIKFTNFHGNHPLCCPGRANLLTGQYAHHNQVIKLDARLLDERETIATELKGLGYHTGVVGKYLNHTHWLTDKSPLGWDYVAIHENNSYYNYDMYINDVTRHYGSNPEDYSTDVFRSYSSEFFENAPRDLPIFAYLNPFAPHAALEQDGVINSRLPIVAPRHKADPRCQSITPWKPVGYNEEDVTDKPAYIRNTPKLGGNFANGWPLEKVCGSLLSVDEWVGEVVSVLQNQGRYENTIFILMGDNGMTFGAHRWDAKNVPYATQLPLFVTWIAGRGEVPAVNNTLLSNIDIAPTLCEFVGCVMGPYPKGTSLDGKSFAGLIAPSISSTIPSRNSIITEATAGDASVPKWKAIMTEANHPKGQWYYVWYYTTGEKELYNIKGGVSLCVSGWKWGDPSDPCLLKSLNGKANYSTIQKSLHNELNAEW